MATEDTNQGFGDFGIKDTMEMGLGNAELLRDLYSDTSTANPDSLTPIVKDVIDPDKPDPTKQPLKGKEVLPPKDGEDPVVKNTISDFLGNHTDDEEEEEEEDKTIVDKQEPKDTDDPDNPSDSNQFTALANDLFKLGVFNKEEEEDDVEIKTPQDFLERFQSEKQKGAIDMVNQFIGQFGEDYQNAFDAIFVKGVNPQEYFTVFNDAVNYAEMDLTIESNQEAVMRKSLTDQGFDKEDVDTEIERLKNYGDLEQVAVKNHKVLIKRDAIKMQEMEQKAQYELAQKAQVKNQYITNVQSVIQEKLKSKEFDGIPINPKLAGELHDFLLVDKYKTPSGELLSDFDKTILDLKKPENHATKVKIALLLKVLESDPNLTSIQKKGVTTKTDALFSEVARQATKDKSIVGKSTSKSNTWNL